MDIADRYVKIAISFLGSKYFDYPISFKEVNETSLLNVTKKDGKAIIEYGQKASLFYGLTLLKQSHKKESFEIHLKRHFDTNGAMHDCSRNGALNIDQTKEMILVSALFGLNRFMLYIEDIYEIEGEPYFGYLRGRYTKNEIAPLVEYAEGFGITLIPCIQTLSHLNGILKWPRYWDIFDSDFTIRTDKERTYELIRKMLIAVKETFKTNIVHIGLDEARDIGQARYVKENIVINKREEFLTHLNKVTEIAKEVGIKPLMWADMAFQLDMGKTEGSWTSHNGKFKDQVKKLIPDVGLVYWDYYSKDINVYQRNLSTLLDTGKETYFAGGAISWIGYAPNIVQSNEVSRIGLKAALNKGIKNVFTTSWGDDGNECSVVSIYPTLAIHCLFDFYGKDSPRKLSALLKAVTGDDYALWSTMQLPNQLREIENPYVNPSKCFLYQDILTGLFDKRVDPSFAGKYVQNALILKRASRKSKRYGHVYDSLFKLCDLLSIKVDIGVRLRKAYKANDKEGLKDCLSRIKTIQKKLNIFLESFRYRWMKENKSFGFDINDGRLGFLSNRVKTAYITLKEYLEGVSSEIPELEQDILVWNDYDPNEDRLIGYWHEMASVNVY